MRRGEIWTVSGGGTYTGKPRPAVIVQDDDFDGTASVTICVFITDDSKAPFFVSWSVRTKSANVFAATLLMPLDDFRRQIGQRTRPTLDDIGGCANRYDVSLTAATCAGSSVPSSSFHGTILSSGHAQVLIF